MEGMSVSAHSVWWGISAMKILMNVQIIPATAALATTRLGHSFAHALLDMPAYSALSSIVMGIRVRMGSACLMKPRTLISPAFATVGTPAISVKLTSMSVLAIRVGLATAPTCKEASLVTVHLIAQGASVKQKWISVQMWTAGMVYVWTCQTHMFACAIQAILAPTVETISTTVLA